MEKGIMNDRKLFNDTCSRHLYEFFNESIKNKCYIVNMYKIDFTFV